LLFKIPDNFHRAASSKIYIRPRRTKLRGCERALSKMKRRLSGFALLSSFFIWWEAARHVVTPEIMLSAFAGGGPSLSSKLATTSESFGERWGHSFYEFGHGRIWG